MSETSILCGEIETGQQLASVPILPSTQWCGGGFSLPLWWAAPAQSSA